MLFFGKKKSGQGPNAPKTPSVLGMLVDPHIGDTVRPLRETTFVFVQLLASVFAAQDLFPRNHPALLGVPGARLTLPEVMGTAWRNVSFTRERMPQALLFLAVAASLGFAALAGVLAIFSLFIGKAHAQAITCGGGYFAPCDPTQDIALGWINYIFNGQTMYNYLNQYGQVIPQSTVIQAGLITALGFYSDAILIVAAIMLFYHLAAMVVETAHHGVVMGKRASQVWAPIRLVLAIGLLVPIAGGLNTGQYIVITVAEWGSNLASQVWSVFVNQLAQDSYQGVAANAPYGRKAVYDTVMMEACAALFNGYMQGAPNSSSSSPTNINSTCQTIGQSVGGAASANTIGPYQTPNSPLPDGSQMYIYDFQGQTLADQGVCGHLVFAANGAPDPNDLVANAVQSNMQQNSYNAWQAMETNAKQFVQQNISYFLPGCVGGQDSAALPPNDGTFTSLITNYDSSMQNTVSGFASTFGSQMSSIAATSSSQGWVSAGAWFNTIAREQSDLMDVDAMIPATQPPAIRPNSSDVFNKDVLPAMQKFEQWLNMMQPQSVNSSSGTSTQQQLDLAAAGFAQSGGSQPSSFMDEIFYLVDWVAQKNGVWTAVANSNGNPNQNFTLGVQFTGANPLAELAYFGHANIKAAYQLFDNYVTFLTLSGTATGAVDVFAGALREKMPLLADLLARGGAAAGKVATGLGAIIGLFTVIFFTSGVMLAFFIPLIPFFRFMFNILTWIVSLLEAVIAVPLIALAHLNPNGEGLMGDSAKAGYHFMFQIFLRPVLMVFGLITGILIFFVAASLMNMLYMQAVVGTGGLAHGHLLLSRFIYSLLYVFVLYMAANSSFHMIDWLPEHAGKWMGLTGMHYSKMGDPDALQQPMTLVTGYADNQLVQGMGQLSGPAAFAAREAIMRRSPGQVGGDFTKAVGNLANQLPPGSVRDGLNTFGQTTGDAITKMGGSLAPLASSGDKGAAAGTTGSASSITGGGTGPSVGNAANAYMNPGAAAPQLPPLPSSLPPPPAKK